MSLEESKLNIKSIAETIDNYGISDYVSPEMVILALELERTIEKEINCGAIYSLGGAQEYLYTLKHFKMNEKWNTGRTDINYKIRLQNDLYQYYCLRGMQTEKQVTGKEVVMEMLRGEDLSDTGIEIMWKKFHKIFFDTYKNVMKYSEYIPDVFDDVICETVKEFKRDSKYNRLEYIDPEPLLFMFGFLSDLLEKVKEEKPDDSSNCPF